MDLREMRLALDKKEIGAEELAKSYIDKIEKTDKIEEDFDYYYK